MAPYRTPTGLYARTAEVPNARSERDKVIEVVDGNGELVCWSGPLDAAGALATRELFETGAIAA